MTKPNNNSTDPHKRRTFGFRPHNRPTNGSRLCAMLHFRGTSTQLANSLNSIPGLLVNWWIFQSLSGTMARRVVGLQSLICPPKYQLISTLCEAGHDKSCAHPWLCEAGHDKTLPTLHDLGRRFT